MKKAISTLILAILFGELFLFGTNKASAEESSVFRLYPLTNNNIIDEKAVKFGSLDFGEPTSYVDEEEKTQYHTHNGVDIMVPKVSEENVIYVYPYKDSGAYVVKNSTVPQYATRDYPTKFDKYWNSVLVVFYPSLDLYVYYGHITSNLEPNRDSKINMEEPLGTIRESYGLADIRTTNIDHLHLGVSTRFVNIGWGYSEGALSEDDIERQGWINPIEFMRGNGETLQADLNEQANNTLTTTESTATTTEETSTPNLFRSIENFFKSLKNEMSGFWNKYVKPAIPAFGAEPENQCPPTSGSDQSTGSETTGNATAENASFAEPSLSSPNDGSTFMGSVPTLKWSTVSSPSGGQIKYYVETFDCPTPENSGWITNTTWTPSAKTAGVYNWRVKAIDMSTRKETGFGSVWQYTLTGEYPPPSKPSPSHPINGSTFKECVPTLHWSSVSSPSGGQIKYFVQTFDCPSIQNSGWITDTTWTPSDTTPGVYNWHVKAIDVNTGKESGFGSDWQYTITAEYPPPSKPSLISPSNSSTCAGSAPILDWSIISSPSGGQIKYYVETFGCPSPQNSGWITITTWRPSATTPGVYNWHVKAIDVNTGKESGFGSVWQFTLAEYQPPSKPTLSSPSNGSRFTGSVPTLQWSSVSSPSGGQIKYFAETFDCPTPENSGWITNTTWTPSATTVGLYNWHVKAIDLKTGKESGFGSVWQYTLDGYQQPSMPSLVSPSSGITIQAGTSTTFSWSNTGATRYKIRLINHSGAGSSDINVYGTSYTFTPNIAGNWTWKVCESLYTGIEGPYSIERPFTVSPKDTTIGYDTDSGTFMFALCALSDNDLYRSPLDTGYAVPTAGGYILKCELMENVVITYKEYQKLQNEGSLEKMVHGSLWDISINHIYEYPSTDPEGCFDIVLDVSIDGGYTDTYRLNRIPIQNQPAYLMYMGDAIYEFTETKQFFISGDTEVIYEDLSEGLYGESGSETFKEYLEKGGFRFGFSGKYAIRYCADVSKGRITCLWPEYGY